MHQLYEESMMMRAWVSPSSILIHVSGPTLGEGERKTMLRTPCPHPVLLYPPYLRTYSDQQCHRHPLEVL